MLPAFSTASERGLAVEFANKLEAKGAASPQKKREMIAVATTLKLAAGEPKLAVLAKQGDAFAKSLDPDLPLPGLLLIAAQLQTTDEFRAAAPGR